MSRPPRRVASFRPPRRVLHAGTGGLHHLVVCPAAPVNVLVAKPHRNIIDQLRDLKTLQLAVATVFGDERFRFHGVEAGDRHAWARLSIAVFDKIGS